MRLRRGAALVLATGTLVVAGGSSAQAWTWATSGSPLSVYHDNKKSGGGYGTGYIKSGTVNTAVLTSTLSDLHLGDGRTYAQIWSNLGNVRSGRRDDGGTAFVRMSNQETTFGSPVGGRTWYAKVCLDQSWSGDPCSVYPSNAGL